MFQKNKIYLGNALDVLKQFPSKSINQCITSPPYYGLREYDAITVWDNVNGCDHNWNLLSGKCKKCAAWKGELGQEPLPHLFINHLIQIFNQVKRVLINDGSCWVVISDSYGGTGDKNGWKDPKFKNGRNGQDRSITRSMYPKSLLMIPEQFAIVMIKNGWILRNKIIWHKKNGMPSPTKDRFTVNWEYVYFFTKKQDYYFKTQYTPYAEASLSQIGEVYNGQGTKDYEENNVQNPSNVKRRIITSMGKTKENYDSKYTDTIHDNVVKSKRLEREESRLMAVQLYPNDRKAQQKYINFIHDHGNLKTGIKFGGNKKAGGNNAIYSGKEWTANPNGSIERAVWTINTKPSPIEHYAIYPEELVTKIIDAGCPLRDSRKRKGTILDPFCGTGTTCLVALKMNRFYIGIEAVKEYYDISQERINFIKNIV